MGKSRKQKAEAFRVDWKCAKLEREDWDFSKCFDDEVQDCFDYEFARESKEAISYIERGRAPARRKTFENLFRLIWEDRPEYVGEKTPPTLPAGLFSFCPEWPDEPYLSINRQERKRRLKAMGGTSTADEIGRDLCKLSGLEMVRGYCELGGTIQSIKHEWQWYAGFEIDWRLSNEEMIRSFKDWLNDNRPSHIKPIKDSKVGAGSPQRRMRADLKALGAFRLMRKHGTWLKAHNASFDDVTKKGLLAYSPSAWTRAKQRAASLIRRPFYSFV